MMSSQFKWHSHFKQKSLLFHPPPALSRKLVINLHVAAIYTVTPGTTVQMGFRFLILNCVDTHAKLATYEPFPLQVSAASVPPTPSAVSAAGS